MMNIIIMYSNFVLEYRNSKTSLILKHILFAWKILFFYLETRSPSPRTYLRTISTGWLVDGVLLRFRAGRCCVVADLREIEKGKEGRV